LAVRSRQIKKLYEAINLGELPIANLTADRQAVNFEEIFNEKQKTI
jgi:hypothetical protein